ncbi:hypothetical protein BG846_00513 [Streptomyces fradiae ATCC 10745 = DSM 40063]|uniref:Uncharacterized protein n=1 Tax=Streptomyces fradiae ATCC 10745 = DSM 40063 TaxID=1319510 RepID=A0A1Y2P1Y2_STRFR|nr:hypothetical protein BG846_00513 [Streptomyces fradiae ATCC 10745 = DSM 40063]
MPARFGLTTASTTMAAITSHPVSRARYRQQTNTASPTTAADGPVSTTRASEAGSPSSGVPGPRAMPTRAYVVPASVATYATTSVRVRPRQISAIPKTTRTCASAPHTGRSSAGTNSDRGVRASAAHSGSSARTDPTAWTGPYPHGWFCTSWNSPVRHTAAVVRGTARGPRAASAARTAPNSGPHSRRANARTAGLTGPPPAGARRAAGARARSAGPAGPRRRSVAGLFLRRSMGSP